MDVTLLTFKNVTFPPLIQDAYFDNNQLKNLESVEYSTCSGEGNICPELPKLRKSLAVEIRTNHGNLFQSDFRISLKGDYRPLEEAEGTPGDDTMKLRVLFPGRSSLNNKFCFEIPRNETRLDSCGILFISYIFYKFLK